MVFKGALWDWGIKHVLRHRKAYKYFGFSAQSDDVVLIKKYKVDTI